MYLNSKEQCLNILDDRNGVSEKYCEADELGHKYFYIDYMIGNKKDRNLGFFKIEKDIVSIGLRGVPFQCGKSCDIYAVDACAKKYYLGAVNVNNGYGMGGLKWITELPIKECVEIRIPLYGDRYGRCILKTRAAEKSIKKDMVSKDYSYREEYIKKYTDERYSSDKNKKAEKKDDFTKKEYEDNKKIYKQHDENIVENIAENKWEQLLSTYHQVHIFPEAQAIVIKPKDLIILTEKYHDMANNSFLLHSYYNYRQLLLLCYPKGTYHQENCEKEYYIGVAGIYHERDCRLAQLFGFEGFESGEGRMHEESERKVYNGCFGYYMKKVEL